MRLQDLFHGPVSPGAFRAEHEEIEIVVANLDGQTQRVERPLLPNEPRAARPPRLAAVQSPRVAALPELIGPQRFRCFCHHSMSPRQSMPGKAKPEWDRGC